MATRVVLYVRTSTDEQSISNSAQEQKLRAYALALDLDVVAVEVDTASAKTLDRPALSRALACLRINAADALVVIKLDRLTRSVADLATLLTNYFGEGKSNLISLGESVDTRTAAGRLVLNVMTSVAQWEREAISERTKTALAFMKSKGQRTGGVRYGYRDVDGQLVPDEAEQTAIAAARTLRATGMALRAVAATMAEQGLKSRAGKPFTPQAIATMAA